MNETVIAESLENLVSGSRLSMSQIASKWGVSTALLSQIKNRKKNPSLELGLKILRESGASLEKRKAWLGSVHQNNNELGIIMEDEKKERVEYKLKKSFSEILESNPLLLDIFLDISLNKDSGYSWNGVLKNYGEYGLELVSVLLDSGLVRKEEDRYFIVNEEVSVAVDLENSFGVVKSALEVLKQKAKKEQFRGEFYFEMIDISPQGYQKLKNLHTEFSKKTVEIIKEETMPKSKGGLRILTQNIVAMLKCFALVFCLSQVLPIESAQAQGGVTGGGSGKVIQGINTNLQNLKRSMRIEGYGGRLPRKIRVRDSRDNYEIEFKNAAFQTEFYASEKDAIDSIVEINKSFTRGEVSKSEARHLLHQGPLHHCERSVRSTVKDEMTKVLQNGGVKPLGFKVESSYAPDGTPRYKGIVQMAFPCQKKED
ncbi:MAG: hypothetical protein NXH75_12250 [Halobacteriovoraceae bacterium]|nr:hypothetical protein [Halobacteriovoraceae bacterium]